MCWDSRAYIEPFDCGPFCFHQVSLPTVEIDCSLAEYIDMICGKLLPHLPQPCLWHLAFGKASCSLHSSVLVYKSSLEASCAVYSL